MRQAGPGICGSKYVEDAKAAHIVVVWGSSLTTWRNSTDRRITRASADAGPELAGRESHAAMESPQALIAPLERGSGGFNKSSSDDRPGPGICGSKYMEDAKAARSVRVWDRVPIQKKRVLRRTSEDSPEERQLPTLPPGLAVPSAMTGLASLFGMGRGGSPSL